MVDKIEDQRKPEDFIGHRNAARQVLSAEMSLTSVFRMARIRAAGDRHSAGELAAVGKNKYTPRAKVSLGIANRKQVEPVSIHKKENLHISVEVLCSHYRSARVGQVLSRCPQMSSGHLQA